MPVEVREGLAAAGCFPFKIGAKLIFFKRNKNKARFASEMFL